jgi:hypothetical protein
VQNRAGAEKADARDDLRGDASGVAVRSAVRRVADLRNVDRQLRSQGRTHANQNVRSQSRRFAGHLSLETDRSTQHGGEEELGEHTEAKRLDRGDETRGLNQIRGDVSTDDYGDDESLLPSAAATRNSARVEIA